MQESTSSNVSAAQSNWCNMGNDSQNCVFGYMLPSSDHTSAIKLWSGGPELSWKWLACLYTTGAMRTTPKAALEIIVGLSPLSVYIRQEAMMACCHLQLNAQWVQANCGHMRIKSDLMINAPCAVMRSDKILPKFYFDKNYEVHIPTRDDWNKNRVDLNEEAVCFTDGSWLSGTGQAGAGVYNQTRLTRILLAIRMSMLGISSWDLCYRPITMCNASQLSL